MGDTSNIEWCDSTFNPWMGCTKVSPACDHCYAERDTKRFGRVEWGAGKPRLRTSAANWRKPLQWNAKPFWQCAVCGLRAGSPMQAQCVMRDDALRTQHRWEPARRRVFCASLADVFDNEVDPQWRHDLFGLIKDTPNLDWLLLTKRIGNVLKLVDRQVFEELPNIWLGATVVNQAEADRDIPKLLAVPTRVRFLSIEPMLGAITLDYTWLYPANDEWPRQGNGNLISWVICGGESGPKARPMHPDWVRSLRDQCAAAGAPMLFKQWGEWAPPPSDYASEQMESDELAGKFNGEMLRVGKKAAGRLLDGRTHDGFPASANEVPQT